MLKVCLRIVILSVLFIHLYVSCDNSPSNSDNDGKTTPDYAKVTFENNTQFHVSVYRYPGAVLFFDELAPGESRTGNVLDSVENHIGTTFRYLYRLKLSDANDDFSREAFAEGDVGDLEETFVITNENGVSYTRKIPIPINITFDNAYIRVKNDASFNVSLGRFGLRIYQEGNRELMVPAGRTGIYRIGRNDLYMGDYSMINVETPYYFPVMTLETGFIYDFTFTEIDGTLNVIPDTRAKIKSIPTSTWVNEITRGNSSNFSNAELNAHLTSIVRRLNISNWRSNYPVNKIIYFNNRLINCEMDFGVIPVIIQNTGIVAPYELPSFSIYNTEWENATVPSRNFYAGNSQIAYNTIFNDVIQMGNNYVVLSTYSTGLRTGLWLFFINEQGQIIDSWDIGPINLEGLIGTKLVKIDENNFLVLGSRLIYTSNEDEHFTESLLSIYKYQLENNIQLWSTEYKYPLHFANLAICGLLLDDSYFVCGTASDNNSTKTIIMNLNKLNGDIIDVKYFGTGNESMRPFAVNTDKGKNIYITGISTEGVTSKAYILKLNSSCTQVWLNKYGSNYDNFLFDLDITNNLLTAVGSSNDGSVYNSSFYGWQGGNGWIIKIDIDSGIVLKEVIDNSLSSFNSIARFDDGSFVLSALKSIDNAKPYWFNTFAVKINERLSF
jgi:hypothetical protein